jgi:hypothetical protein
MTFTIMTLCWIFLKELIILWNYRYYIFSWNFSLYTEPIIGILLIFIQANNTLLCSILWSVILLSRIKLSVTLLIFIYANSYCSKWNFKWCYYFQKNDTQLNDPWRINCSVELQRLQYFLLKFQSLYRTNNWHSINFHSGKQHTTMQHSLKCHSVKQDQA